MRGDHAVFRGPADRSWTAGLREDVSGPAVTKGPPLPVPPRPSAHVNASCAVQSALQRRGRQLLVFLWVVCDPDLEGKGKVSQRALPQRQDAGPVILGGQESKRHADLAQVPGEQG